MNKILGLGLIFAMCNLLSANEAEALAEKKCGGCHVMGVTSKEKLDNMKAPPYWAIAKKTREAFATKEEAVKFTVDYTLHPAKEKMLFPQATIDRFGLMPSQEGKVTKEEIELIASYILADR